MFLGLLSNISFKILSTSFEVRSEDFALSILSEFLVDQFPGFLMFGSSIIKSSSGLLDFAISARLTLSFKSILSHLPTGPSNLSINPNLSS